MQFSKLAAKIKIVFSKFTFSGLLQAVKCPYFRKQEKTDEIFLKKQKKTDKILLKKQKKTDKADNKNF